MFLLPNSPLLSFPSPFLALPPSSLEFLFPVRHFSCLTRWWNRKQQTDLLQEGTLDQWEKDYLLNAEPEFRMFYEYHDVGKFTGRPAINPHSFLSDALKNTPSFSYPVWLCNDVCSSFSPRTILRSTEQHS